MRKRRMVVPFILCALLFLSATSFAGGFHFGIVKAVENRIDDLIKKIYPPGSVIKSIPSPGSGPGGLAWDGNYLWCLDITDAKIYQLST